jgi:hypothetical protein
MRAELLRFRESSVNCLQGCSDGSRVDETHSKCDEKTWIEFSGRQKAYGLNPTIRTRASGIRFLSEA